MMSGFEQSYSCQFAMNSTAMTLPASQQAASPAAHSPQQCARPLARRPFQPSLRALGSSMAFCQRRRHGAAASTPAAVPAAAAAAAVAAAAGAAAPPALALQPFVDLAAGVLDEAPEWTLDQAVGLVFGGLLLLLYLSSTQVDKYVARGQRRDLGICEECGGLYEPASCQQKNCPSARR